MRHLPDNQLAGIIDKRRGPHVFRHTAASLCKANGMDILHPAEDAGPYDIKDDREIPAVPGFNQLSEEHAKFSPSITCTHPRRSQRSFASCEVLNETREPPGTSPGGSYLAVYIFSSYYLGYLLAVHNLGFMFLEKCLPRFFSSHRMGLSAL